MISMRALRILPLIVLIGCASPKPWEPRPRDAPWDARPLDWLLANQNPDGSWGEGKTPVEGLEIGRIGVTSFALEAISTYGFTQFSKDVRNGRVVGDDLRRGLDWLIAQMGKDGTFRAETLGALDQALGTCALLGNFSMSADKSVQAAAESALAALMKARNSDGTWGAPMRTAFAIDALSGARLGELPYDERALDEACGLLCEKFLRHPDWINACMPSIRYLRNGKWESRRETLDWVVDRAPDPGRPDFLAWYLGSRVIYANSMSGDPEWRKWTEGLELAVGALVNGEGYWDGPDRDSSIVRTAFVGLCHACYQGSRRFESVFGPKK